MVALQTSQAQDQLECNDFHETSICNAASGLIIFYQLAPSLWFGERTSSLACCWLDVSLIFGFEKIGLHRTE